MAPRLAAASIAITASGRFGTNPATRSPGPTPAAANPARTRRTCSASSA